MYKRIEDFHVGQEVYVQKSNERFTIKCHTIKSISPKERTLILDDGTKISVIDNNGNTDIGLYEYAPDMGSIELYHILA
jgi:hypothetical protein